MPNILWRGYKFYVATNTQGNVGGFVEVYLILLLFWKVKFLKNILHWNHGVQEYKEYFLVRKAFHLVEFCLIEDLQACFFTI